MKSCPSIFNPPPPPQPERKRKLVTPIGSPSSPAYEECSSDVKHRSVNLDPPQQKQKLGISVRSPSSPVYEESSSDVKLRSVIVDPANKLETPVDSDSDSDSPLSPLDGNLERVMDSGGYCGVKAVGCSPSDELIAKVGLHCYNFHKETNLQFMTVTQLSASFPAHCCYQMVLDAFDPDKDSFSSIQTSVWDAPRKADLTLITDYSSLVGSGERGVFWDPNRVDPLYQGVMPEWLDNGALTGSKKIQYYELNASDLLENEWLHLYAEVGAYAKWISNMFDHLPVKVKKAVVQTKDDLLESSLKLKSKNAIFYITFETRGGVECKCIIRQTNDEIPRHMCLEVNNVVMH